MWISRQFAFLMRASKGGLTHGELMGMTWRQFGVYLDAFTWILREEGDDEAKEKNKEADLIAMKGDEAVKEQKKTELEDIQEKMKVHKQRALHGRKTKERKLVQ